MIPAEILRKKRIGNKLNSEEINFLVSGMKTGEVSDLQISAFLTSSCINGLSAEETAALTFAMRDSGNKFDFSHITQPKIDKHSTGGVGDKLSLLLVPLAVSCGLAVPMISGRGLGHTGGTLDKLESISGFNIKLGNEEFYRLMKENHCFMASQTEDLVPADRKMYQIRDITGNVDSIGLITASILSKKFVEDLDGLVLDMKVGNGAIMKDYDSARLLAESMANVAKIAGLRMRIVFSSMEQPLGHAVGNWLEVQETFEALNGNCPSDIRMITEKLASAMLLLGNSAKDEEDSLKKIKKVWDNGTALKFFRNMIVAQGGNLEESAKKYTNTPRIDILSDNVGTISHIDTHGIGIAGILLGAGRRNVEDKLDYGAGLLIHKKLGDEVKEGVPLVTIYATDTSKFAEAGELIKKCFSIGKSKDFELPRLILDEWII
jgi:pyrimidine-nucleoside phosphorylase